MQRAIHRFDADWLTPLSDPRFDSVDEPVIGLGLGVLTKPLQVDDARIISTARLELHVTRLSVSSQDATDGGTTDAEHLGSLVIARRQSLAVGVADAASEVERNPHLDV